MPLMPLMALILLLFSSLAAGDVYQKSVFVYGADVRSVGADSFASEMHHKRMSDVMILVKDQSGAYRFDTLDSLIAARDEIDACFKVYAWISTFRDASYSDGWDGDWVNPADSSYRYFLLHDIISPLVESHNPDGIILDDIRYPGGSADEEYITSFIRAVKESLSNATDSISLGICIIPAGDSGAVFYGQNLSRLDTISDFFVLMTLPTMYAKPLSWVATAVSDAMMSGASKIVSALEAVDVVGERTSPQYIFACANESIESGALGFAIYYYPPDYGVWSVARLWGNPVDSCIAIPDTSIPPVGGSISQIAVPVDSILVWGDAKSYLGFQLTQNGEPTILVKAMPSCYRSSLHTGYPYDAGPFYHYDADCGLSHWYITAFKDACPYDGTYGTMHFTGRCPPRNSPYSSKWDCPEGQITLWHYPSSSTHEDMDFCSVCGYEKIYGSSLHLQKFSITYSNTDPLYFSEIDSKWYVVVSDSNFAPTLNTSISSPETIGLGDTFNITIYVRNEGDGNAFEIGAHIELDSSLLAIIDDGDGSRFLWDGKDCVEWERRNNGLLPGQEVSFSLQVVTADTGECEICYRSWAKLENTNIIDIDPDDGEEGAGGYYCKCFDVYIVP